MSLVPHLQRVVSREHLSQPEAEDAMREILEGRASQIQIAAFLVALRMKGETADELVGFARAMRQLANPVQVTANGAPLLDTCGTGGDCAGTFNISTVAAFAAAGAGVRVAKHGNRSISSACGSADLLEQLGIRLDLPASAAARAIEEVGIGFLFAPAIHPAMKYAQPVRVDLKMRSVFNLLGPLTNPACADAQLVGAPSAHAARLMAGALASLGLRRGFVAHGSDGLDEITTTGDTQLYSIREGVVESLTVSPEDFGVPVASKESILGGTAEENAEIARQLLHGAPGARRDIVLVNAGAALVASGKAESFREGAALAAESIDSGAAWAKLEQLARFTSAA